MLVCLRALGGATLLLNVPTVLSVFIFILWRKKKNPFRSHILCASFSDWDLWLFFFLFFSFFCFSLKAIISSSGCCVNWLRNVWRDDLVPGSASRMRMTLLSLDTICRSFAKAVSWRLVPAKADFGERDKGKGSKVKGSAHAFCYPLLFVQVIKIGIYRNWFSNN